MIEIGLTEYFGMAEAIGIIGTMLVVLYFQKTNTETVRRY
jgi:hypothetical protein